MCAMPQCATAVLEWRNAAQPEGSGARVSRIGVSALKTSVSKLNRPDPRINDIADSAEQIIREYESIESTPEWKVAISITDIAASETILVKNPQAIIAPAAIIVSASP